MEQSVKNRQVSLPLGILVEKRKSKHPWGDWNWIPVDVVMNSNITQEWQELVRNESTIRYHAATLSLVLHRKDTEALYSNLMLPQPVLYVVLLQNPDSNSEFPYIPHVVTASEHEMQDWLDAGDGIVEKVAMPEPVAAFIQAFVEEHHVEEEFIKRKRDKIRVEEQKFGKNPIFEDITKH